MSIDWGDAFVKPLLTTFEAEIALGDLPGWWEKEKKGVVDVVKDDLGSKCCEGVECCGKTETCCGGNDGGVDYPMDYYAQDGGFDYPIDYPMEGVPRSIRDSHKTVRDSLDGLIISRNIALFFSGGDRQELKLKVAGRIWKEQS